MRYSRPGTGKAKLNAVVEAAADFIVHGLSPSKNQPSRSTNESKKPEQRLRLNYGEYEFYRTYRITEGVLEMKERLVALGVALAIGAGVTYGASA